MDLKVFYQKLRKIEQEIADPHVLVVSNETSDGGRAGQKTEVTSSDRGEADCGRPRASGRRRGNRRVSRRPGPSAAGRRAAIDGAKDSGERGIRGGLSGTEERHKTGEALTAWHCSRTDRSTERWSCENYENAILSVVNTEQIDLAGKSTLAQNEIATEVLLFLLRRRRQPDFPWMVTSRQTIGVSDVFVTDSLRRWHAHKTLALVYRDAYNNQLNDRYQGKWKEYEQLAKASAESFFQIGVGVVSGPLPKAALPVLNAIPGNGIAATYYVAVAWVNQTGQAGSPSDVAQLTTFTGQQLLVSATKPPANATGWNAYIGESPDGTSLQNNSPIAIGDTWSLVAALQAGPLPGQGQQPTWFLVDQRLIERG